MHRKKILVPIGPCGTGLKSVHYAMALAKRLHAQIYILQQTDNASFEDSHYLWLEEALLDLINNARQAGILVSHYIAGNKLKEEIVDLVKTESIDFLIFSTDEDVSERLLLQIRPFVSSRIIQVREKDSINYLKEGDSKYGTCNDFKQVSGGRGRVGPGPGPQDKVADTQPRGTSGTGQTKRH